MKTMTVEELMVPLAEYATVSSEATLYDAVKALEKAQQDYNKSLYPHRAILVYGENKKIIGKISQLDILRALEPQYDQMIEKGGSLARFGFSLKFQKSMIDQFKLWDEPFNDICEKAAKIKVQDFFYTPSQGEYVKMGVTLDEAIHQLVMGHHQSLLVTKGDEIVGVLRLTDVFMAVFDAVMTTCKT
ncbi:CBS domain-containing protein [Desulfococcaceae bacterium HSG8]|nr:CBS domain-containing protein [Desulfococcaceae bacterium HSG8]